ncbi:hypothetical protein Hanom_Chr03g00191331 [Helianthus anomalus]
MGAKDKFKDEGSPADAYVQNALFKRLSQCPSECTVIPEGALVMAGMSLIWRDMRLYPSFQRDDEGKWSLFDFVDPPRNAALRATYRVTGEQETDILKIHLEQFLLPVVPADPSAYISQSPPSGGSSVSAAEARKPIRVKVTGRKYMAAGATTSAVAISASVPEGGVAVTSAAAELVSPTRALKKHWVFSLDCFSSDSNRPCLTHWCPIAEVLVEGVTSMPLTSVDVVPSAASEPSISELISQASAAAICSSMPPPVFTIAMAVTTNAYGVR